LKQFFSFWDASYFARYLVDGDRSDAVPAIALREGEVKKRSDILIAAAEESNLKGRNNDFDKFIDMAQHQADQELDPTISAGMFLSISDGYARVGQKEKAKLMLLKSLAIAERIDEGYISNERFDGAERKLDILIDIANRPEVLGTAADVGRVLQKARSLAQRTTGDPSYYLPRLAEAFAVEGQLKQARDVAEQVRDGDDQLSALAAALRGYTLYKDTKLRTRIAERPDASSRAICG
jgi:hypothetical protein